MNSVISIFVLVTIFCMAIGYDFDNDDYNEYLADKFDMYRDSESLPNLRFRRDEDAVTNDKCKYRRKKICCAENSMEELHEKEKEVKRECFKRGLGKDKEMKSMDPFKCDNVDKHKKDMICVMQCVGQKNDVLNEKGDVKEEAFRDFIKQTFSKDPWFAEFQDKIIETCLEEAKNATESMNTEEKSACNPAGIKLAHCVFAQTQLNCPDSEIKDAKSCSKLRERIRSKMPDGVPPPPPFLQEE
ncbi:hypothetical protein WA026_017008 [Henosepilachna vigintioctopunctata]|uniref:Uncharacterized protein n=1 Tax=Henosepilachna vigintioctopunctata TaxID=420089 RepID=A0AAW1TN83_9CUCU